MEKTLTFTVEDALLSPVSFAMLSGAGVVKGTANGGKKVHVHMTTTTTVGDAGKVDLTGALGTADTICKTAPIFVMEVEKEDGSLTGTIFEAEIGSDSKSLTIKGASIPTAATPVMVDYYVLKNAANVTELQIDAEKFAGYFYVEADTLFRAQKDGKDYPANITLPNVKIQSNWTFSMASSGDPSTFTFTMDAMPGYTYFDQTKKILCVIQVVEDSNDSEANAVSVMGHVEGEKLDNEDSVASAGDVGGP